jgi:alpha-tubulin suppressor-like RCC1 family protein
MRKNLVRLILAAAFAGMAIGVARAGTVMQVAAGGRHTCAVTSAGGVKCWGDNTYGQLGDGTTTARSRPVHVVGLTSGVTSVAAGYYHTCALTTAGGLKCWGANGVGQLGNGSWSAPHTTPVDVVGLTTGVRSVTVGRTHTCAVTTAGSVKCWGGNDYGQLGDHTDIWRASPFTVVGLSSGILDVAAGWYHNCARRSTGGVMCWGRNLYGQIGDGTLIDRWTPFYVEGLVGFAVAVAAGGYHSCARTSYTGPGGSLKCWGFNYYGQLGDGTTDLRTNPVGVVGLTSGVEAEAGGYYHTCALTAARGVKCWGFNGTGQLGNGTTTSQPVPVDVLGLTSGVSDLSAGANHSCALASEGGLWCWGSNTYGQLGDGTTTMASTPVRVVGLDSAIPTDLTGDGRSDVLWRHTTRGEVWLWPMDGATRLSETFVRTVPDTAWEIRGAGDQTGDGQADILWRHATTGLIYLWPMDGSTVESETYVGIVDPSYDIVGTGDYNGDGRSDILWRHLANGEVWIWLMDGATPLSQVYVDTVDPAYAVVGSGDVNGDTKADILWRHSTYGEVWVWLMNGTTRTSQTHVGTVPDVGYEITGLADHTGDGKADILWRHATRGEVWIWPMDGTTVVSESYVDTVPDTGYEIVGTGDYDGDGKADILWCHATRGEVWVWLMDGTTRLSQTWVATVPEVGYQIWRPAL